MIGPRPPEPTLLIVEDQCQLRELLRLLVEEQGWHAEPAADGPSALASAINNRPDAVLLDVGLPGEDGLAVAQRLRVRYPDVPVVIMTALGQASMMAAVAGTEFYLDKPFDLHTLISMLDRVRSATRTTSAA